jgi:inner membrane protein
MMFWTHLVVSLLVALVTFPLLSIDTPLYLVIFLFAALFPDIDSASSFIGKRVKVVGWLFRHRGVFHSIWIPLAVGILVWSVDHRIAIAFMLGYLTHLAIDMLTYEGVMPFFPFHLRPHGFIRTNSLAEYVLLGCSLAAVLWLMF